MDAVCAWIGLGSNLGDGRRQLHDALRALDADPGIDVLREIRAVDTRTPVLMLTARTEEADKVLGLELGCDDYLTKPFSFDEFLARIRALFRRDATKRETALGAGNVSLDIVLI